MVVRRHFSTAPVVVFALVTALLATSTVVARSEPVTAVSPPPSDGSPSASMTTLPEPADGTAPVRFAIAGPVSPSAARLVLIAGERSCGVDSRDQPFEAVHAVETQTEVVLRLDAVTGPRGTACASPDPVRVPIVLMEPLGERAIRDAGRDPAVSPLVNRVDPIDTGYRYSCGGSSAAIVDLLGPGLDVSGHGPVSSIPDARAIVDSGDIIEYLGPFRPSGTAPWEAWWFHDGDWQLVASGDCRPAVELVPGLAGGRWRLRGPAPSPASRRVRVWVSDPACSGGRSPRGRIARPIIEVSADSIVIILGVEPLAGPQDCQGSAPAPYVVQLPVAIGDRNLYDGSVFPPRRHDTDR